MNSCSIRRQHHSCTSVAYSGPAVFPEAAFPGLEHAQSHAALLAAPASRDGFWRLVLARLVPAATDDLLWVSKHVTSVVLILVSDARERGFVCCLPALGRLDPQRDVDADVHFAQGAQVLR